MDLHKMHWSTEPFCVAYSVLVTNSDTLSAETIEATLRPISDDLRALLAAPPKSETSRQTLGKRVVSIDSREVELNEAFVNAAVRVADELNLDEIVAAHLVFYAAEDSKCLGVDVVESAISLFYVRRQYIIDMVRFGLESLPMEQFSLVLGGTQRVEHIFSALKAVEQTMEDLNEKSKSSQFMGFDQNPQFRQLLELQREFLIKEHDGLGGTLNAYLQVAGPRENDSGVATQVLKHLAAFNTFDSRMLSYFPALVSWFSARHTKSFIVDLHTYFSASNSQKWSLSYWQSALALVLYTFLSDEELYPEQAVDDETILSSVRHSIDEGAIEFFLALAQDIRSQEGSAHFDKYRPLVRSRVPTIRAWLPEPSALTLQNTHNSLETVITAFITNLADILKEMRLSEEDMYLAMNELDEDPQAVSPGEDLERFFLLVAATYRDSEDSIEEFFTDPGNALYGFLMWGSECQASFMSATFTELLSSLASGEQNSLYVHKFLVDAEKRQSLADDVFLLSWRSMYDVIDYYIRELTAPQSGSANTVAVTAAAQTGAQVVLPSVMALPPTQSLPTTQARSMSHPTDLTNTATSTDPPPKDQLVPVTYGPPNLGQPWGVSDSSTLPIPAATSYNRLSDDTLLVLSAYLGLVARVAGQCTEAKEYSREKADSSEGNRDFPALLFRLLRVQQPLVAAIFAALGPFARQDMWPQLDTYVVNHLEEVLTALPEVLSFVQLLEALVRKGGAESPRLPDYIDFVAHSVLVWTASVKERTNFLNHLQLHCIGFLQELLDVPSCQAVVKACFSTKVYEAIFSVVTIGVDEIINLNPDHPEVSNITRAVKLIGNLLKRGNSPLWNFNKPVLYNLHIIPHLALYSGTGFENLSLACIEVLRILEQSAEFRPTITRQSRILSILSSTSEATRIRVGIMTRIQDPFTSVAVKAALLTLVVDELEQRESPKPVMTAAHYILGFRQSDLGLELKLELDKGVGGIASGNSMFGVICDLLLGCLAGKVQSTLLLKLSSQIIGHLTIDSLTSEMVLDYLRPLQFVLTTISLESVNPRFEEYECFYEHRAIMLDIWTSEVQKCQEKVYLTLENHYLERLEPIIFTLLDFMRYPRGPVTLRCLKAWSKLIPVLIASGNSLTGPYFVLRAIQTLIPLLEAFARESPIFAQPIASLLASLLIEYESRGVDAVIVNRMQPLLEAALLAVHPSKLNIELRTDVYTICFNILRMAIHTKSESCSGKVLGAITSCGPHLLQTICDDALGSANENLRVSALSFLQVTAFLARSLNSDYIVEMFVQYNFITLLVAQALGPLKNGTNNEQTLRYSKIALSLLLQLGQTRSGAFDILHTPIFEYLDSVLYNIKESILIIVVQLLCALIISVGADSDVITQQTRKLLEKHRHVVEGVMKRDSAVAHTLQGQNQEESTVSQLARAVTVLTNLIGASF